MVYEVPDELAGLTEKTKIGERMREHVNSYGYMRVSERTMFSIPTNLLARHPS